MAKSGIARDGDLRFGHLEAFVQLAETGSYTKAGSALGLNRSQVRRDVQSLERWLGNFPLFDGNTPAGLSPSGEQFIGSARKILELTREGRMAVQSLVLPPPRPPVRGVDVEVP